MIKSIRNLDYEKQFETLNLPSLHYRRYRGDMIAVYNMLHDKYDITDRVWQVCINNTLSDSVLPVISGIPHGSILGPLLFLVYMNNISSSIEVSQVLKFADEMKCFMTISCDEDRIKLQQYVDSIIH